MASKVNGAFAQNAHQTLITPPNNAHSTARRMPFILSGESSYSWLIASSFDVDDGAERQIRR